MISKLLVKNTFKVIVVTAIIVSACKKKEDAVVEEPQPTASFTASKTQYIAGESIVLTNSSANAGSIRWTLPNGTTETSQSISYPTSSYTDTPVDIELPFRLDALSPSGNKTDYSVKNIKITPQIKGRATLWIYRTFNSGYTGTLSMDGVSLGEVTVVANSIFPTYCGIPGYTTMTFPTGIHNFTFTYTEDGNIIIATKNDVEITENGCAFLNFN